MTRRPSSVGFVNAILPASAGFADWSAHHEANRPRLGLPRPNTASSGFHVDAADLISARGREPLLLRPRFAQQLRDPLPAEAGHVGDHRRCLAGLVGNPDRCYQRSVGSETRSRCNRAVTKLGFACKTVLTRTTATTAAGRAATRSTSSAGRSRTPEGDLRAVPRWSSRERDVQQHLGGGHVPERSVPREKPAWEDAADVERRDDLVRNVGRSLH